MGYLLKVWGYSVLSTTALFMIWAAVYSMPARPVEFWIMLPVCLMMMLLFSAPAFALHLIVFWKLVGRPLSETKRKLILIPSGYVCMVPSFLIFRIALKTIHFSTVAGNYLMLFMLIVFTLWSCSLRTRLD